MRLLLLICWALFAMLAATVCRAEDFTLHDGRVLKNARILEKGLDYIRIEYDEGFVRVAARDMSPTMKEQLDMTDDDIRQRQEEQAAKIAKAREDRQRQQNEINASLSESERLPKYLTARHITAICAELGESIQGTEAEFIAAKWNLGEARRLSLNDQANYYTQEIQRLQPVVEQLRNQRAAQQQQASKIAEDYQSIVDINSQLQAENITLGKRLDDAQKYIKTLQNLAESNNFPAYIPYPVPIGNAIYYNGGYRPRPIPPRPRPIPRPGGLRPNEAIPGNPFSSGGGAPLPKPVLQPNIQPNPAIIQGSGPVQPHKSMHISR